jgi:DNA-binding HxlR family transcriptional regulator
LPPPENEINLRQSDESRKYAQICKWEENVLQPQTRRELGMKPNYGCPVQATINVLAGKWKVMILWHLGFGTKRFAELKRLLPGVSEKVLTDQLRQLQADRVIERSSNGASPARVDYRLSDAGKKLIPEMERLCRWGSRHFGIVPNLQHPRKSRSRTRTYAAKPSIS